MLKRTETVAHAHRPACPIEERVSLDGFSPVASTRMGTRGHPLWHPNERRFLSLSMFFFGAILGATFSMGAPQSARAQSQAEEYRVKAALLFRFAQFIEWPPEAFKDANDPLNFCTYGDDPFQGALDEAVTGKKIGAHAIRVRHLRDLENAKGCQLLFVGAKESKRIPAILAAAHDSSIVTVGESDGFAQNGGVIGFLLEEKKIRFEINAGAAQRAGVKISSRLMLLAKNVFGNQG
jgi:YfiR/HmsC-like